MTKETAQWVFDICNPKLQGSEIKLSMSEPEKNNWVLTFSGDGGPDSVLSTEKHATDYIKALAMVVGNE